MKYLVRDDGKYELVIPVSENAKVPTGEKYSVVDRIAGTPLESRAVTGYSLDEDSGELVPEFYTPSADELIEIRKEDSFREAANLLLTDRSIARAGISYPETMKALIKAQDRSSISDGKALYADTLVSLIKDK